MSFRFQSHVIYEQLLSFSSDVYSFSGRLPEFEKYGLIEHLRYLAGLVVEDFASGLTRTNETNFSNGIDKCLVGISRIVALVDLCLKLEYASTTSHHHLISSAEELTKRLYEAKKTRDD